MDNFFIYNKLISPFITFEPRRNYLQLKKYSNDDWRLIKGSCLKKGYEPINKVITILNKEEVDKEEVERCSLSRAKKEIIEIARCNYFKYFVTLTISSKTCDRFSLEECQNLLHKNFKEYQRRCKRQKIKFKYLVVTEKHEKGGYHFHALFSDFLNGDLFINDNNYYSSKFFDSRLGYFSISEIKNKKRCAFYISKYVTKSPIKSETNQLYFCSKGLARAEVFDLQQSAESLELFEKFWRFDNKYVKIRDFDFSKIDRKYQLFLMKDSNFRKSVFYNGNFKKFFLNK